MAAAPVIPLAILGTGAYLAWFGVHYWRSDTKWPTDPVKSVLRGQPAPKPAGVETSYSVQLAADVTALQPDTGTTSSGGTGTGTVNAQGFTNPIGKGLTGERIDMGVDYGGSGPLYALGPGTITATANSGWPGGTFICIHLDEGHYVYYAEDITPLVSVGQRVKAGDHIGYATGGGSGIEVGWAAPPGTGATMAASLGQQAKHGDAGSVSTACGKSMSDLIASLGGPAGKLQGTTVSGSGC
jgi:hypothetical protein